MKKQNLSEAMSGVKKNELLNGQCGRQNDGLYCRVRIVTTLVNIPLNISMNIRIDMAQPDAIRLHFESCGEVNLLR